MVFVAMDSIRHCLSLRILLPRITWISIGFLAVHSAFADTATGKRGAIATVHPLATDAGMAVLESGGNAVDAAIAAALTLGVVDNHNSGLGGGCFILLRTADGRSLAIDGRETAPAKATRQMFLDAGRRLGVEPTDLSTSGPLAVGTPGALAAYVQALRDFGRLELSDLIRPAADIAERGFPIDAHYAANLSETIERLQKDPGCRSIFFRTDGGPLREGDLLRQPDLAHTYRQIAEQGPEWFYRGGLADRIGAWMEGHGGLLATSDFAAYRAILREPIRSTYRGLTILGMPPPSSGGIHVAQILNILENYDLKQLQAEDPVTATHVIAEAMKIAFADRAYWLGDADFVDVPRGLISKEYAQALSKKIDFDRATPVAGHGEPPGSDRDFFTRSSHSQIFAGDSRKRPSDASFDSSRTNPTRTEEFLFDSPMFHSPASARHTTHIAAADSEGNWVAITATVNTTFGAKIIVPGTGLVLNNEMDDFSIAPGIPNAFGLVGAEANAIAPGKRPLSSMSPTFVLQEGQPILTVGAAGGPKIITQVVLTILRTVDFGCSMDEAIAAPRFHHQWRPPELMFERSNRPELPWALAGKGHAIRQIPSGGVTQAIARSPDGGAFVAVADPRVPGKAAGR